MKKSVLLLSSVVLLVGTMLISCLPAFGQIDENYSENVEKAFAAGSIAECQSSLKFCNEVLKVTPHHPVMNYLAARLNEQLGNSDIALKYLRKAAKIGYTSRMPSGSYIHTSNDPVFTALRGKKEFQEIVEIMKISDKPIHKSKIVFTVNEKRLSSLGYKEGIAYDPVEKMFYFGSEHKIFKVDHLGNIIGFTKEEDRLGMVNGIHVDPERRILWACSNGENWGTIFKYDLSSLRLVKKYAALPDGSRVWFNDLVIHPNGDVITGKYIIPNHSDTLELFFKNKSIMGPNGITLSDDGRVIYAATEVGIYKIDLKTKSFALLTHGEDFHTYGIDGLYFKNNSLYAIQNYERYVFMRQVSRFLLNKDATHIESCEILEKNTSYLNNPTTGVFVDDYFYFIAGSNQEGVVVMKAPLNKPSSDN